MNLGANFISKMSKLFGKVGRVQEHICPKLFLSILGFFIGRVDPLWTYVQNIVVFFLLDPLLSVWFYEKMLFPGSLTTSQHKMIKKLLTRCTNSPISAQL